MITNIPLNKLVPSPRNVRRSSCPDANLELKADIEAHGLLQNLVVTSVRKPKGCFAVEAGERRRQALQALADDGKLPGDHPICCLVLDGGAAKEASLAENFQRLAMNPADECLAFQQLIANGADSETIARRFGLTVRFVDGRLRLANLAPAVFEALGAGEISLDVAKAYAATADIERQAYVFEQAHGSYMANHADTIRRMMTQATVSSNDRRARLVGEDAYVASGGRIERDLFADADDTRWLDVAILERLAAEKMAELAANAADETGLAFVRPTLDSWVGYPAVEGLRRVSIAPTPLTDQELAEIERLEERIGALVSVLEDEASDEAERVEAETAIAVLDRSIDQIRDKPPMVDDALKARTGKFLLLGADGQPRLDTAFYELADPDEEDSPPRDGPIGGDDRSLRQGGLPRRLLDELAIQRRDILAAHIAADPGTAFDLAAFLMADQAEVRDFEKSGSTLSASRPADPVSGFGTPEARATLAQNAARQALNRSWTEATTRSDRFDAFTALSANERAAWLGHAVARTLEASLAHAGERACPFHDHLGALLGISIAEWWRPTGANYFDRVPKSVALVALAEVGGPGLAAPYAKSKKAELVQACERIFAGDFIAEIEVKQAALAWVPSVMRFGGQDASGSSDGMIDQDSAGNIPDPGVPEPVAGEIEEAA